MQGVVAIFNVFEKYPGKHFQYYKGRKCMFRDRRELKQCTVVCKQLMHVGKLAWPSLNANQALILGQYFPNHFMSL